MMDKLIMHLEENLFSLIMFTTITYLVLGTVLSAIILFIGDLCHKVGRVVEKEVKDGNNT